MSAAIRSQLLARFIVNLPDSEYRDRNRLLYNLLQAQWFRERMPQSYKVPNYKRYNFQHDAAALHKFGQWLLGKDEFRYTIQDVSDFFRNYYYQMPVCGAIVYRNAARKEWLTVQSPYTSRRGFPKGKINNNESDADCACREVHEETGICIRHLLKEDDFVEYTEPKGKRLKFYNVVLDQEPALPFQSDDKREIKHIGWSRVDTPPDEYVKDSRLVVLGLFPAITAATANNDCKG